ncbi:PREDICTED: L-aminoadipate-semialdehyde dehydrogenase-phosphopantetheinyl transferase-like [Amphimedon queenslandica]|uniref:L-aminoadipate-semialdehyde dehydrogenase-phosphopantetheinyl transferase n=1 Tax=Amphimedon queenslandica TaxID=400682 RepID=A0A1X7V9B0_AMPQE|nr:PREDICTED: L-aminoadipate-semialdehyde dehydrogenase-phosphopantetheinyl transferase-like [Amphimedon queenslandica]|eukprot:XP_003385372.1 PREDICTED: L-aminoadipate-semialdehyde dehydrogenase-phosphopantetheinyl transferase-like [Amphimedon queenslandica]
MAAGLRWYVSLSRWKTITEDWNVAMSLIQPEESERINQFVFKEDASLSLIGRLLLRAGTAKRTGATNNEINFDRTERGKPYLVEPSLGGCGLDLNVSHQGDYAVLAGEEGMRVGVDVMDCTRPRGIASLDQFFTTMRRQFTEREWHQIRSPSSEEDKLKLFYRFWCLKESYIKATGIGLSHGLQRLEFTLDPSSPWKYGADTPSCSSTVLSVDGIEQTQWSFEESFIDRKHCVAVAIEGTCHSGSFIEVTVPKLLESLAVDINMIDPNHWELQKKRPSKNVSCLNSDNG